MGGLVTLTCIPTELHLEILRRMDVLSILDMRGVNAHFRDLIDASQDTILRPCLRNVECTGVHAVLLKHSPPERGIYTLSYAKRIHAVKTSITKVSKICTCPQNAKVDALYCIRHICEKSAELYATLPPSLSERDLEIIRHNLFAEYTTTQLQHMTTISVRLVFKLAQLMGHQINRSTLRLEDYNKYNSYLLANGPSLIVELAELPPDVRQIYLDT